MTTDVSRVLGERYEVGPPIGHGGMAEVRRGYDRKLERTVAIKCFAPGSVVTDRARLRFEEEARCAAAIAHPNAVAIYDAGVDYDTPYIVMECLPGVTLADKLRDGELPVPRAIEIIRQLLAGLEAAHTRGVLHRDITAANVLFTADDRVKLTDFGIARSVDSDDLTETGAVVGTPSYLAPERVAGEPATVRSDVYSAGIVAYEALTGTKPFRGDTAVAVGYAILHTQATPVRVHRADVPPEINDAVMRAISRVPEDRFASALEFSDALAGQPRDPEATLQFIPVGEPTAIMPALPPVDPVRRRVTPRRLRAPIATVSVLAILLLGGIALVGRGDSSPNPPTSGSPTTVALPTGLREPFDALQHAVRP